MTNSLSNYADLRGRAVLEYVSQKREEFNASLSKVIAEAVPSTYENPLGELPEELKEQLHVLNTTFTDNLRTRAANFLDTAMYQQMLKYLKDNNV